jgi:hypothetical protein
MKTPEELILIQHELEQLGDKVQAILQDAPISMAAFILFATDGPIEYRSPHPREVVVKHIRKAAEELSKEP